MTLTITATPGSASANSYCTEAEFNAYVETRLHIPASVTAAMAVTGTDTVKRALISATRILDVQIEWSGWPTDSDVQALQWPREGMVDALGNDIDDTIIPATLKDAESELAISLIDADRTADLSSEGIAALAVGSVSIDFNTSGAPKRKVIPDAAWEMVSLWGEKRFESSGVRKLVRC
jgi:hypothetical protein